jgi:hypothetical protein
LAVKVAAVNLATSAVAVMVETEPDCLGVAVVAERPREEEPVPVSAVARWPRKEESVPVSVATGWPREEELVLVSMQWPGAPSAHVEL